MINSSWWTAYFAQINPDLWHDHYNYEDRPRVYQDFEPDSFACRIFQIAVFGRVVETTGRELQIPDPELSGG